MSKWFSARVSNPFTGEGQSFQQMVLGKLGIYIQENEVGPLPQGVSNLRPAGRMQPRVAVNAVQHKI